MSKRIIFTFDDRSYESLETFKKKGKYSSLAEAVRESLAMSVALQGQAEQGYTQIVVRNRKGKERELVR
jgi:hypothetical protein